MSRAMLEPASRDDVLAKLRNLSTSQMKKAHRMALKKSSKVLSDKAKYYLKTETDAANHPNWWDGKSLQSGIRVSVNRDVTYASIHILGDFRLKFFEDGTKLRRTGGFMTAGSRQKNLIKTSRRYGAGIKRGRVRATDFFTMAQAAVRSNMQSVLNRCLNDSIKKVWEQG